MRYTDVLVIGGSAAGLVAALTGKSTWPDKEFTLVKMQKDMMVPCGIPYIFGTLESSEKNIMPVDTMLASAGVESVLGEVTAIDKENKNVTLKDGDKIAFDRLVIATGSTPLKPSWLNGKEQKNVFVIPKDKEYLDKMNTSLAKCKKVVVVGAGFIGVEMSDELKKRDHDVTLVEKEPLILSRAFDKEVSAKVLEVITSRGVKVEAGKGIKEISGNGTVTGVILDDGSSIDADAVILSMGYKPNSELAKDAGIPVNDMGFISVDEYMRTSVPNIFAVGDCAEKRDFVTRKKNTTMLASTACAEARIAGLNLFNLHVVKTFSGTIAIYSTAVGDHGFGTAGITEAGAAEEGLAVLTGVFEGVDRHPGNLPGAHKQMVKLITAKHSGVII
ncbi:MAG: FAD-dependent oxidoreductase, partial [Bacteroidales bacterium]|nr:FAD-dependent oxidoreductase [Bacteroidales bacterium]